MLYNDGGDMMYDYISGKITDIKADSITLDNNGIGYLIYTPNPYLYELDKEYKVFIYQHVREEENTLFGFSLKDEKELFLKLISVKGVGPKTALPILATGSISGIIDAIERENILYLKKFPKIGDKVAGQIILDLKGKFKNFNPELVGESYTEELQETLKSLGYKDKEIKKVVVKVDKELSLEEQVKEALKLLLK